MDIKSVIVFAGAAVVLVLSGWACYAVFWKEIILSNYYKWSGPAYYYKKVAAKLGITKTEAEKRFQEIIDEEMKRCAPLMEAEICPRYRVRERNALAFGTPPHSNKILCSANWIELLLTKGPQWRLAFIQSVGHEMGHHDDIPKDMWFSFRKRADRKFYYWLSEIRCDYKGVQYAMEHANASRNSVLKAIRAKAKKYTKQNKKNVYFEHPPWSFRTQILTKHPELTEDVIRKIAVEAGCTNQKYIQELIDKTQN